MDLTLYFAYGSNLHVDQMHARCPTARLFARATLPGYQLAFRGASAYWGGAVATLGRSKTRSVPGVLYAMRSADLEDLDHFEGHPLYYERRLRTVVDEQGARWQAHVYILPASRAPAGLPGLKYVEVIAEAYGRHGFDLRHLKRALRRAA